jgi:hypothetical protein
MFTVWEVLDTKSDALHCKPLNIQRHEHYGINTPWPVNNIRNASACRFLA